MSPAKQILWNQSTKDRVILVSGPEDFLASRFIRSLCDDLRKENPGLEVSVIDASEYESGQILDLTSPSLFDEPRFVIVEGVERCSDALLEDSTSFLTELSGGATLLFRHAGGVRGKKLLDALKNSDSVTMVQCDKLVKETDRIAFATAEFKNAGRPITQNAIRQLVSSFGEDSAGLAAACSQLMQDTQEPIDEALVAKYYGGKLEVTIFKVIDSAMVNDIGGSLTLLRHAFDSGQDPVSMVGAIAHRIRNLAKLSNNRSVTAQQLGVQPFAMDRLRKEISGWTEEGIANVIIKTAAAEAAVKGQESDAEFVIERLLMSIAQKGRDGF